VQAAFQICNARRKGIVLILGHHIGTVQELIE
jgi:hypothetical protein